MFLKFCPGACCHDVEFGQISFESSKLDNLHSVYKELDSHFKFPVLKPIINIIVIALTLLIAQEYICIYDYVSM